MAVFAPKIIGTPYGYEFKIAGRTFGPFTTHPGAVTARDIAMREYAAENLRKREALAKSDPGLAAMYRFGS